MKKWFLALALFVATGAWGQPKVIAHRGYWTAEGSAQNSLTSWSEADRVGCYGSEFDVWLTGDNRLVVNHDRVQKGTDIDMTTASAREIRKIVLPNGEPIPTLDAYLRLAQSTPATRLILELKTHPFAREDVAVKKIVRRLRRLGLLERTDFISFSLNACLAFRKALPEARIYYLTGDIAPKAVKNLLLTGIDYSMATLRQHPEWIAEAHQLGLEVNVWTVNREEDMRQCIAWGVDYITTDYPERLQALLK
ncbi:MAG: glycerophosphodiester phosphodiesterase [Rikenellaceae bacterium]|nr:glycerophosphodiester phosphodiesterase [Rikenellaceae bacterium]